MVEVHLKGALEPLLADAELEAIHLHMSGAAQNNLMFFRFEETSGDTAMITLGQVLFLRERKGG